MWLFFFKQKTAYEMLRSLVGSEMCIRDRYSVAKSANAGGWWGASPSKNSTMSKAIAPAPRTLSLIHI